MAGKHRAKTGRRQTEAYVWIGTGAITLGLGVALAGGSGVANADTTNSGSGSSAATTSIRTTVSAQSVNTSTHSSRPVAAGAEERATSVVSSRESVVRQQNPAITGDSNSGPGPTLAETAIALNQGDLGAISGIPGLESTNVFAPNDIPFIELGGGGGGLLSKIAGALSGGGMF